MAIKVILNVKRGSKAKGRQNFLYATLDEEGTGRPFVSASLDYCLAALADPNRAYELANPVEALGQLAAILKEKGLS